MASLSTQFWATKDELAEFAETWMADHAIYAIAVQYWPFMAKSVTKAEVRAALMDAQTRELIFTEKPPDCAVSGHNELLDKNPGALKLNIGRLVPRGLEQSQLSTLDATPTWRKIARHLKRHTTAGVVDVDEETGESGYERTFRYTAGAKALDESGVAIRQYAQFPSVFHLGKPEK